MKKRKSRRTRRVWSPEEIEILIKRYPAGGSEAVERALKEIGMKPRGAEAIRDAAALRGLKYDRPMLTQLAEAGPASLVAAMHGSHLAMRDAVDSMVLAVDDLGKYARQYRAMIEELAGRLPELARMVGEERVQKWQRNQRAAGPGQSTGPQMESVYERA